MTSGTHPGARHAGPAASSARAGSGWTTGGSATRSTSSGPGSSSTTTRSCRCAGCRRPSCASSGSGRERGKVVLSGARVVNLVDRAAQLAGPGQPAHGRLRVREPRTAGAVPAGPAAGVGGGGDRRVQPGAVRAAGRPCCATAARTRTPARCCSPSSAGAARPCRSPAKLWGYVQDWTVAYGYRPGPGRGVDGGAVGGGLGGLRAREPSAAEQRRAPAVEPLALRPGPAAAGDRSGPGRATGSCAAAGSGWPRR